MPGGSWRWGTVAAGVVWACSAGTIHAQATPAAAFPPSAPATARPSTNWPAGSATLKAAPATPVATTPVAPPAAPPATLPPAHPVPGHGHAAGHEPDYPVKDLTPKGHEEHHHEHLHKPHAGHLNPLVPEEKGVFVNAEALIFRPRRGAFDFAVVNQTNGLAVAGPIQSINYDLTAGVRGEVGYQFGHCGWDVLFGYTYFRSSAEGAAAAPAGGVLLPTLTRPGLVTQATTAVATANLEYNLYDMFVGKRFVVDDNFAVRTFGGLRFANIRQDFQANYDGLDANGAGVRLRSDFQGFGPVAGAEAVLVGDYGFHLYARASGGLLTGLSKNPYTEVNNVGLTVYSDTGYDLRKVVPVLSVGVGGGWQYKSVTVRAGYEITNYFDLIDQPRFTDDVTPGKFVPRTANLSLEGLFVQVGVQF